MSWTPERLADFLSRNVGRIVCHFSCGAASAVATMLILAEYGHSRVVILNAFLEEEHPDNRRFLADCQKWFDHPITVLRDEKYGASAHEVWKRKRFLSNGVYGAPCAAILKREVIDAACNPFDVHVMGYTAEEGKRVEKFLVANQEKHTLFPLWRRGITHAEALGIVERAGIELPMMYRLGYNNANCIGCCKGGEGYWNKIRRDFPEVFAQVVQIQSEIGPGSYLFRDRKTGERYSLADLPPGKGKHKTELPDCGFACDIAEQDIEAGHVGGGE